MGGDHRQGGVLMALCKTSITGSRFRKGFIYALLTILIIFWSLQPIGLRPANCLSTPGERPATCTWKITAELPAWMLLIFLIVWDATKSGQWRQSIKTWKRLWPVGLLLLLALLSITWSAVPLLTLERSLVLIAATFTILYVLQNKRPEEINDLLAVFFALLIAASYILIFLMPATGRMLNKPYDGAWCGVFWHRNYLGSFMAFGSTVYLFRLLFLSGKGKLAALFSGAGIAASAGLVVGSHSGAGILTLAVLTGLTLVIFLWTKIKRYMKPRHYYVAGVVAVILVVAVLTNLDFAFGLVNRNTSLTGRVPLWQLLYQEYVSKQLLFGNGLNAIWAFESVRTGLQTALGWGYPVLIGDNGIIDILLHLGVVGAIVMIAIICFAFYYSGKYAISLKTGISFMPLVGMVFVVMSNISLSMLLELEFFVWAQILYALIVDYGSTGKMKIEKPK